MQPKNRVVILISGNGSNMESLIKASREPNAAYEVVAVISNNSEAGGLAKAKALSVTSYAIPRKEFKTKSLHEAALLEQINQLQPDLICLAGYMQILSANFLTNYNGKVINIHPSILPLFTGLNTYERALDSGMAFAGCTVHFVNEILDGGKIIGQAVVPICIDDTPDSLNAKILKAEHILYPMALNSIITQKPTTRYEEEIFISCHSAKV